jgi:hypothetical protein
MILFEFRPLKVFQSLSKSLLLKLLLSFSVSFLFVIVYFRAISFKGAAFSREMPFFTTVKTFPFLLWGRNFFKSLLLEAFPFLKASLFFSEGSISFLIHFVGVPLSLLPLKIVRLIIALILLGLSSEIVVEARNYRD